jgi:hypothetical protein
MRVVSEDLGAVSVEDIVPLPEVPPCAAGVPVVPMGVLPCEP